MIYFQYDARWQATFVEYEGTRLRLLDSDESGKANGLRELLKDVKSTEGRVGHGTCPYSDEVWDALLNMQGLQRKP